jgi:hypothetical protein
MRSDLEFSWRNQNGFLITEILETVCIIFEEDFYLLWFDDYEKLNYSKWFRILVTNEDFLWNLLVIKDRFSECQ